MTLRLPMRLGRALLRLRDFHTTSSWLDSAEKLPPVPPTIPELHPGIAQFFEDPKNWGESELKTGEINYPILTQLSHLVSLIILTGRPWSKEELRLKSNSDLHKLW